MAKFKLSFQCGQAIVLDEAGADERWRLLREALKVLAENNPGYLKRMAPEGRKPAERLLEKLSLPQGFSR